MQNNSSTPSYVVRRLMAFLYDSFLLIAVFFVVTSVSIAFNEGVAIQNHAFKLVLYVVGFFFFSWFWRHGGQTLGMQAWRIKVVSDSNKMSDSNSKLTYKQCLKRYLCGTFLFGITLIAAMFIPSGQGLHDVVSRTRIIYKNK